MHKAVNVYMYITALSHLHSGADLGLRNVPALGPGVRNQEAARRFPKKRAGTSTNV